MDAPEDLNWMSVGNLRRLQVSHSISTDNREGNGVKMQVEIEPKVITCFF